MQLVSYGFKVKIPHIIAVFQCNLINKWANPLSKTRIPDLNDEELVSLVDNFVTNNDTIELTSSLDLQSDTPHICALDAVLSPQVSEILLLHILIDG